MDKDYNKGLKIGLGFITIIGLLLGIVYAVGFHTANEILPGQFATGNYSFNGNLGIGTNTPSQKLEVNGSINISSGSLYFADGSNQSSASSGKLVQVVYGSVPASSFQSSTIPNDNSIPLISEGTQIFSKTLTPSSASNIVIMQGAIQIDTSKSATYLTFAFFRDNISIGVLRRSYVEEFPFSFVINDTPGTTSQVTYSIRAGWGGNAPYTIWINNFEAGPYFEGQASNNGVLLMEIVP